MQYSGFSVYICGFMWLIHATFWDTSWAACTYPSISLLPPGTRDTYIKSLATGVEINKKASYNVGEKLMYECVTIGFGLVFRTCESTGWSQVDRSCEDQIPFSVGSGIGIGFAVLTVAISMFAMLGSASCAPKKEEETDEKT